MHSDLEHRSLAGDTIVALSHECTQIISRRIWLPTLLYRLLPLFYIAVGTAALISTFYVSEWYWLVPHGLVLGAVCLHLGLSLLRKRRSALRRQRSHLT